MIKLKKFVIIFVSLVLVSNIIFGFIPIFAKYNEKIDTSFYEEVKNSSKKENLLIKFKAENAVSYSKTNQIYLSSIYKKEPGRLIIDEKYVENLKSYQDNVVNSIVSDIPIKLISSFQIVFNGILIEVSGYNIRHLLNMSEIDKIYSAREKYYPLRDIMIETIHASDVWNLKDSNNLAITGEGTTIGIIDSGIDYNHPDFSPTGLGQDKKVISGYDWADGDDDPIDDTQEGHGTHVSGIAASNNPNDSRKRGVAPQSKLYAYKVFSSKTGVKGAPFPLIMSALEQSIKDKCTVVNMSLGNTAPTHSIEEDNPYYEAIKNTRDAGIVVVAAAGNDGSRHKKNPWPIHAPGIYEPAIQVAASTDRSYQVFKAVLPNGFTQTFNPYLSRYTPPFRKEHSKLPVVDAGFGRVEDFKNIDVKGKIALISRGPKENTETGDKPITFKEKNLNAKEAGAVGCIVYNYDAGSIGALMYDAGAGEDPYTYSFGFIPNLTISGEASKILKRLLNRGAELHFDENSYVMISDYTSAGPCLDGDLNIFKPEISAPGTTINSAYPGGKYVDYQGTSMATPAVSGSIALIKQAHPDWTPDDIKAVIMNTSDILKNGLNDETFSFLYQGAGQINVLSAIQSPLIATPHSIMRSIEQIDDNISISLKNVSNKAVSVSISSEVLNISKNTNPLNIEIDKNNFEIKPALNEIFEIKLKVDEEKFEKSKYEGAIWINIKNRSSLGIATEKLHIPFIIYKNKITDIPAPVTDLYVSKDTLNFENNEENLEIGFCLNSGSYSKYSSPSDDSITYLNYATSLTMYIEDEYGNKWGDIYFAENIPVGTYKFYWDGKDLDGNEFLPEGRFLLKIETIGRDVAVDDKGNIIKDEQPITESLKIPITVSSSSVSPPPLLLIGVQNKVNVDEIFATKVKFADCKNIESVEIELSYSRSRLKILDVIPDEFSDEENFSFEIGQGTLKIKAKRSPNFVNNTMGNIAIIRMNAERKGFPDLNVTSYKLIDDKKVERRAFLRIPRFDILTDKFILGDLNDDKNVDEIDLNLIMDKYYLTYKDEGWNEKFDLNNDMIIDIDDIIILSKYYGI